MRYDALSAPADDQPPCPDCGLTLPVMGTSHPAGDQYQCVRCDKQFRLDAEGRGSK